MKLDFLKNIIATLLIVAFFATFSSYSYSQNTPTNKDSEKIKKTVEDEEEDEDIDTGEIMKLEEIDIKVEPVRPMIELKRREIPPKDYTFFRSFEQEVQQVPNDLLRVKFNTDENKVDDLKVILSKERK